MTKNDVSVLHTTVPREKGSLQNLPNFETEESLLSYMTDGPFNAPTIQQSELDDQDGQLVVDYCDVLFGQQYYTRSLLIHNISDIQLEFKLSSTYPSDILSFSMTPSTVRQCESLSIKAGDKKVVYLLFSPDESCEEKIDGEAFVSCRLSKDHHESIKLRGKLHLPLVHINMPFPTSSSLRRQSSSQNLQDQQRKISQQIAALQEVALKETTNTESSEHWVSFQRKLDKISTHTHEVFATNDSEEACVVVSSTNDAEPLNISIISGLINFEIVYSSISPILSSPFVDTAENLYSLINIEIPSDSQCVLRFRLKNESSRITRGISGEESTIPHYEPSAMDGQQASSSEIKEYITIYNRMSPFEKYRISLSKDSDDDPSINVELLQLHHVMMQKTPKSLVSTLERSIGQYLRKFMTLRLQGMELQKKLQIDSIWNLLLESGHIYISPNDNILTQDIKGSDKSVGSFAKILSECYFELDGLTDELISQSLGIDTTHSSRFALLLYTVLFK